MSYVRFDCGCERDGDVQDAHVSGPQQSEADRDKKLHHYPADREPAAWCIAHASERPCECDRPKKKGSPTKDQPKKKGAKR